MRALTGTSRVALAVAAFLGSLCLVSWRQREALDTMTRLEALREEHATEAATEEELSARIRDLESRARVVTEAERRLGMRKALATEIVNLPPEGS